MRFHDLRATCVTWMAVRRDTAERIMQRVGHEDWPTMKRYMRTAEALGGSFGAVFGPLPGALTGTPRDASAAPITAAVSGPSVTARAVHFDSGFDPQVANYLESQRRGRDSNPRYPCRYT
jgi:hypothetical protein